MSDELRFEIIINMIKNFPQLREKVEKWLLENGDPEPNNKTSSKD